MFTDIAIVISMLIPTTMMGYGILAANAAAVSAGLLLLPVAMLAAIVIIMLTPTK